MRMYLAAVAASLFFANPAASADLGGKPYRGPVVEPIGPAFKWTGFYLGAHGGYAWGEVEQRQTTGGMPVGPFKYDTNGAFGGGTVGYNVQMGGIVMGVEGDFGWMDLNGKGRIPSSNPAAHQDITLDGGLYGDITGRLGFAANRTLLYGKGGWAWFDGEARQKTTNPGFVTHGTDKAFDGWVAGAGIEHAFAPNITIKVEYLHFDFGHQGGDQTSVTDPPIGFVYKNTTDLTADLVKAGMNFKF